jgi:carbonic anhydrase
MADIPVQRLLDNNRSWSASRTRANPTFFEELCELQEPDYLWIGCADSRVPANEIVGLQPGELFVHRNVANVVAPGDANCLSVLQFAVDVLEVRHIIVCGHYGCGGVAAAIEDHPSGALGHWLDNIERVYEANRDELDRLADVAARRRRLCELNVLAQVRNVAQTTTVSGAWKRSQALSIHGWIYDLRDGLLKEISAPVSAAV